MVKKYLIQMIRFPSGKFGGMFNLGVHTFGQAIQLLKEKEVEGVQQEKAFDTPFGECSGSQVSFFKGEDQYLITTVY